MLLMPCWATHDPHDTMARWAGLVANGGARVCRHCCCGVAHRGSPLLAAAGRRPSSRLPAVFQRSQAPLGWPSNAIPTPLPACARLQIEKLVDVLLQLAEALEGDPEADVRDFTADATVQLAALAAEAAAQRGEPEPAVPEAAADEDGGAACAAELRGVHLTA